MNNYENFEQLMVNDIIPFHNRNISWIRLDGQISGGNRKIYACFYYSGKKWKIHSDTHFEELDKAYRDLIKGNNPFVIKTTRYNNDCLELRNELANKPKHIYIYLCD